MAHVEDGITTPEPDAVADALQQFGTTLAARDADSLANFGTFAELDHVQQFVLDQYEREILEPRRAVWASAVQKLSEAPFTGWDPNTDMLWWEFAAPQMQEVGGRMVHVSAVIQANIPENDQTKAGRALIRNLNGAYMLDGEVMDASRDLAIPFPQSRIARKLHWEPKKPPSREAQHQAAGVALLKHATSLTATVYATPAGGQKERLVYTTMEADAIARPAAIMARFVRPRGLFGGERVELTEHNTATFLERWREDPVIPSETPDMDSLSTFLRDQLTWAGTFSAFNSALTTVNDCQLQTTIGAPRFTPRRKRQGAA